MASSRASSPASPEPLTPRSKIRALLATVESSDEEDGAGAPNIPSSVSTIRANAKRIPNSGTKAGALEDEESDESDVAIRPRGKLASRMQGAAALKDPEDATAAASERVEAGQTRHGDVEDDDLPAAPRRLHRRVQRDADSQDAEPTARSPSPGLFVSSPPGPSPAKSLADSPFSDDDDLPAIKSDRFKALVEREKQERLAREAAKEARRAGQRARQEKLASELEQVESDDANDSGITDDEGGRRLTQGVRPTRKASKKAIEEMNKETQRMARNMQLAHEAKTRKKISKASLFDKFNYRPGAMQPEPKTNSSSRPTTPQTDAETKDPETPPSSPPVAPKELPPARHNADAGIHDSGDEELPSLDDVMDAAAQHLDKGKGKAPAAAFDETMEMAQKPKRVRVRLPAVIANTSLESDDELEVTRTTKDKIDAVFARIPASKAQESRSMKALRALAQVKSPRKDSRGKEGHPGMTASELQVQLYQRARQQAKLERDRRLEMLKAQGVVVQTADERERQEQEVEDLVAKAREEAQKIMQQERSAAKKEMRECGEADPLAWDDSEDEEYENPANGADGEASAMEFSGSEYEGEEEEEGESDEEGGIDEATNPLFDEEAGSGESEVDGPEQDTEPEHDEGADELPRTKQRRARKHTAILSDDEAEVKATPRPKMTAGQVTPAAPKTVSPAVPTSVLRSARKSFIPGLPVQGPAGLGLTQMFAGTMDDSQVGQPGGPTQSMMPDFDQFPDSNFSATAGEPAEEDVVMDSQRDETLRATQDVQLNLSQSQMHGLDSLLRDGLHTQMSDMMEPTQDGGLEEHTPLTNRFVDPPFSTVDTVPVDQQDDQVAHDSPLVRRGRLRRKMDMSMAEEESAQADVPNAFNVMADGARKDERRRLMEEFDRKRTKAEEMVEEQAEESEDEYAGLGGADGEDSDDGSTGSVQEMIDDAGGNVDERQLAAFYADRERAKDKKEVEKLFKDITTGMLRRKRGADYDLSDSDDGGEARRRMKWRQFAKMQKALFADERVKKIAEKPGNQAFLRTIEDRGGDDETDLLDVAEAPEQVPGEDSQPPEQGDGADERRQRQQRTIPDSQPRGVRAPAHPRRATGGEKPSHIGQVRDALSDLLAERHESVVPATEASEDEDADAVSPSDKEKQRGLSVVVDRISLKRNAASDPSASSKRLAFSAQASAASFKAPALLRRATTNSTLLPGPSTASTGGFGDEARVVRKGAARGSGVQGHARPDAAALGRAREGERRREMRKARGAERRVGVVGGLLARGSFE